MRSLSLSLVKGALGFRGIIHITFPSHPHHSAAIALLLNPAITAIALFP